MKKILLSLILILSCLWFSGCDYFSEYKNAETQTVEGSTTEPETQEEEEEEEEEETTAEETEPPIGHTPYDPIPFGDSAEIPASKGDLSMRVLEVSGHTGDIIVKMNLTVENLKSNTRISLSGSGLRIVLQQWTHCRC